MQAMTPGTRSKLEHATRMLVIEFDHLPREHVVRELETVSDALLEAARFDDYIPLLAHRFAREHLLADNLVPVTFADAA